MPDNGVSSDTLAMIENHISDILDAREATIDLEVFILGLRRQQVISDAKMQALLAHIDNIRLGIKRGHAFGKKVRGRPDIY